MLFTQKFEDHLLEFSGKSAQRRHWPTATTTRQTATSPPRSAAWISQMIATKVLNSQSLLGASRKNSVQKELPAQMTHKLMHQKSVNH